jgi:hypothetical protein
LAIPIIWRCGDDSRFRVSGQPEPVGEDLPDVDFTPAGAST